MLRVGNHVLTITNVKVLSDGNVVMSLVDKTGLEFKQTLSAGRIIDQRTGNYNK